MARPFHAAILVDDLDAARRFYVDLLGCTEGRSDADWLDFDMFGNQLVCHRKTDSGRPVQQQTVDGKSVPVPHWGIVLPMDEWQALAKHLTDAGLEFIVPPHIRFQGEPGEQGTFFISDPSGNAIEFKGFRDPSQLFAN